MSIDIRTIIMVLGITHIIQIVVFYYQYMINKNYRGPGWWLMWSAAEVTGFAFMLLRQIPPIQKIAIIIQNSMIILGVIFLYIGIMRFFDKRENRVIIISVFSLFLASLLYFLYVNENFQIRGIIVSAALAFVSFLTAHGLFVNKTPSVSSSANFSASIFLVHGLVHIFRAVMLLKDTSVNLFEPTLLNIVTYLDALIVSILWTFCFIVMINQRLNAETKEAKEHFEKLNAELEQRVIERTAELEAAGKELEAFVYSVAHTMRSPLRALDGFSYILRKNYSDKVDAEGNRLLNSIRSGAHEINGLISDMLDLLRVSSGDIKFSAVNMTGLVNSVYNEIVPPDIREKITFSAGSMPDAVCDPAMMRQLWRNLISNTVKFTLPKKERRIETGCRMENGENIYYIKDTGVGFNPEYTHKLFGIFERLHKPDEFEGAGMGLAIVRRIVSRHGGRVWAEGKVGEGATFWFTIKKSRAEKHEA